MKLTRKQNAPIIIDEYGISHPDLTLKIETINEDKLNKRLSFVCQYYHTKDCNYRFLPRIGDVYFLFTNEYTNEGEGLGWPTYTQVKEDVIIDDDGNLIPINQEMAYWILNQTFVRDFEGKIFGENWEITT